ncbi:hypothetical protein FOCC_FOCC013959 [Frankliniella occidentalis]|nr:hypothetical protein FOCC_FOCC013959 [Frankliniella occidentalis]
MSDHDAEQTSESFSLPSKFDFNDYKLLDDATTSNNFNQLPDSTEVTKTRFVAPTKLPEEQFQAMFELLNQDQRDYVMHVAHHFETSDEQIFHFLTGGAGVGKSMVINTLYQTLYRLFNSDKYCNPEQPKIILCAPTGKAAFNINGQTIHSAFKLQPNNGSLDELSASMSNTLACALSCLKLIKIDEISMVGQQILQMVSQRLQHLKGTKKPFGGVSVLAVGDFFQLNPVFRRSLINSQQQNPYDEIFNKSLWSNFKTFQLKKVMRQNEVNFLKALKHLARGTLTENDIRLLKLRTFRQLPQDRSLKNAIHLFARNVDVNSYNQEAIKKIDNPQYICTASDVLEGHGSELAKRQLLYSTANSKIQDTVGMPSIVQFKVKARHMITYNIDTEDGLCNGATGKLKKISDFGQNEKHEKKPLRVWIKFDEQHVRTQARHKHKDIMKARKIPQSWTPIYPKVVKIKTRKNCSLKVNRMQFALTLAHAITIPKSQGQTMKQVVVHLSNRMTKQLLYVACSRATTIDGLYIIGNFIPTKPLQQNDHMSLEMTRWKTNSIIPVFSNMKSSDMYIAMYHNVQSLPKHQKLIINDKNFTASGLLFFGEI